MSATAAEYWLSVSTDSISTSTWPVGEHRGGEVGLGVAEQDDVAAGRPHRHGRQFDARAEVGLLLHRDAGLRHRDGAPVAKPHRPHHRSRHQQDAEPIEDESPAATANRDGFHQ
jgi:hypothetical protein